jgi:4a-hydroxytetrahydrobiopterin dehydratase
MTMDDPISGPTFLSSPGVEDWRARWGGRWALAHFRTTTCSSTVAPTTAIGDLMTGASHDGDIDLRRDSVTVRLRSGEWQGGRSRGDVELARKISITAREHHSTASPESVQHVQLSVEAADIDLVRPFWSAVVATQWCGTATCRIPFVGARRGRSSEWSRRAQVVIASTSTCASRRIRSRRVSRRRCARAAGSSSPPWWTLADPEENQVDLAI